MDAGPTFRDFGVDGLVASRVDPAVGPFTGGNFVQIRGSGFTAATRVSFGGQAVQPNAHELIDERRLVVQVPANTAGTVDVDVTEGRDTVTIEDGYTYQDIVVVPNNGSQAGGTFVTITGTGTDFAEGDEVFFGRTRCLDLEVVSETRVTCLTPPGTTGSVPVSVAREGVTRVTAEDAFTYFDSVDPTGGLGGGAIGTAINVTVLDAQSGAPVPDVFVLVGEDLDSELQGFTDSFGQVTISASEIPTPVRVHLRRDCYTSTSFHTFDARDITAFMTFLCAPPNPGGGGGPGANAATIGGHLVWPDDVGGTGWFNMPEAPPGYSRVARIFRARSVLRDPDPPGAPPAPALVFEEDFPGADRYPFTLSGTFPGGAAVYAIAGLESDDASEFIPYVMGVARDVLAGPGEIIADIEIRMEIPLDHFLEVQLEGLPEPLAFGPDEFRVQANIDLGGEGFIVNDRFIDTDINGVPANDFDVIRFPDATNPFRFIPTPALQGSLADGRYRVEAEWLSNGGLPYTRGFDVGIREVDQTHVMDGFVGIPEPVAPVSGGSFPADRVLRWEPTEGGAEPSFYIVLLQDATGPMPFTFWTHYVAGDTTEAPIPDLVGIGEIEEIPSTMIWAVFAVTIDGFDFDNFRYTYLNDAFWRRSALNAWFMTYTPPVE